jgi:hypothetical protein
LGGERVGEFIPRVGKPLRRALQIIESQAWAVQGDIAAPDARTLYFELQQRAVTGDKPIPIDSQTFLAGLAVLKTALGEQRVAVLFAALNIDLVAGRYINP